MTVSKKHTAKKSKNMSNRGMPTSSARRDVEQYAGDAFSLAQRTWKGLNEIRKLINIEEKFLDTSVAQTPGTSGVLTSVTSLAQGVTFNTRVGNSLKVQRLEIRGRAACNAVVTTFSLVRILVIRDMEGQGTAPTAADVLENVGGSDAPRQPYDWLNRKRFSMLYDNLLVLAPTTGSAKEFVYEINLDKHVLYRGTTAAAASDGEGSIYILSISDEATNTPTVSAIARVIYTDD